MNKKFSTYKNTAAAKATTRNRKIARAIKYGESK